MYAIFGAGGTLGKALAAELAAAGKPFRVVGRSPSRLQHDFAAYDPLVSYVGANLVDGREASIASQGVETIFYVVGIPYDRFELHPQMTRTVLKAAQLAGVRYFIHVSSVYPFGPAHTELVSESHPRDPNTFKGRMRKQQEDLVLGADGQHGLRTVLLRSPEFYGPDAKSSLTHAIFSAALTGKAAPVIGPIDTLHEFMYVPDLAKTLIALAGHREAHGHAWNLGGPEPITIRRFAELIYTAVGKRVRLRVTNKTMLHALGFFDPIMRELHEMHYLWSKPFLLDDSRIRKLLPGLHKTPYEEGIRATLEAMRATTNP